MDVTLSQEGRFAIAHIEVTPDELAAECKNGTSIAVLAAELSGPKTQGFKAIIPQSALPTSFTIMTSTTIACKQGQTPQCRRAVWGNFWVPGSMPAAHNAHIVQYDVVQSNFAAATLSTHFVNTLLTVSNSNFTSDFQGKGMIIGVSGDCGGNYSSLVETWQIGNIAGAPPVANEQVNWGQFTAPNTCYSLSSVSSYRFLVGANRSQASQYWIYPNGSPTPTMLPTVAQVNNYFWSAQAWGTPANSAYTDLYSGYSYSGLGAAGVAFFVSTPGPIPVSEVWSLSFTNASSVTQP